jgi:hypothetical protein
MLDDNGLTLRCKRVLKVKAKIPEKATLRLVTNLTIP